jgi:phosphoglycolate phosphatase-like HAD superfamily hydrolase
MMSKITDFSEIEKVVWDFDGVWWDYYDIPGEDLNKAFNQEKAKIALEIFSGLGFDEAIQRAENSHRIYGDSFSGFKDLAEQNGMSHDELIHHLYTRYHINLFKRLRDEYPQIFIPCMETIAAFKRINGRVNHTILTHSCADGLTRPFAKELGIAEFFHRIMDYKSVGYTGKGAGPQAISMAIGRTDPSKVVFVEDTVKHLHIAKEAFPELKTVLVSRNTTVDVKPDGVDLVISSPKELLNMMAGVAPAQQYQAKPYSLSL